MVIGPSDCEKAGCQARRAFLSKHMSQVQRFLQTLVPGTCLGTDRYRAIEHTGNSMSTSKEIETQFWKSLKSDRTMMLGLDGIEDGHARPMTAQFERERGPIWFFTAKDHAIVQKLTGGKRAIATFASKGHDLFATVHGSIS